MTPTTAQISAQLHQTSSDWLGVFFCAAGYAGLDTPLGRACLSTMDFFFSTNSAVTY